MASSDHIKNLEKYRDSIRQFFLYGIKRKDEDSNIPNRTFEFHTQFIKRCLGEDIFRAHRVDKKACYSIDLNSEEFSLNPLYSFWKKCTSTNNQLAMFFYLVDYLSENPGAIKSEELRDNTNIYASVKTINENNKTNKKNIDSTASWNYWIRESFIPKGYLKRIKNGEYVSFPKIEYADNIDAIMFFSEVAPVGVIGSFIIDKCDIEHPIFRYKNHYIGHSIDSEVTCNILYAIRSNRNITIQYQPRKTRHNHTSYTYEERDEIRESKNIKLFPLKIYSSTENGKQFLMAWDIKDSIFKEFRIDSIKDINIQEGGVSNYDDIKSMFDDRSNHIWGTSIGGKKLNRVCFSVRVNEYEYHVIDRLYREKRCGEIIPSINEPGLFEFRADIYDIKEIVPWIRTFISRIEKLVISNEHIEKHFWNDFYSMYNMYFDNGDR